MLQEHASQLDVNGSSYLRRIIASSDRLDRLIQDVLNFSRVVQQDLQMEKVDTQELVEDIIAIYPNLQPPRAEIAIETPLPPVTANAAALTQVISNLLGNAVKFVRPGTLPKIRISAGRKTEKCRDGTIDLVRLEFCDNGGAFPRIRSTGFSPCSSGCTAPNCTKGLAIVRKAVERMGDVLASSPKKIAAAFSGWRSKPRRHCDENFPLPHSSRGG